MKRKKEKVILLIELCLERILYTYMSSGSCLLKSSSSFTRLVRFSDAEKVFYKRKSVNAALRLWLLCLYLFKVNIHILTFLSTLFFSRIDFSSLSSPVLKRSEVYKMLTEEQQEHQERRPWQLHHKKSTSSGECFSTCFYCCFILDFYYLNRCIE